MGVIPPLSQISANIDIAFCGGGSPVANYSITVVTKKTWRKKLN